MKTTFYNFRSSDWTKNISEWTKNISKNIFLKRSLEFVSTHFQANRTMMKNLVVRNFSKSLKSDWKIIFKKKFYLKFDQVLAKLAFKNAFYEDF